MALPTGPIPTRSGLSLDAVNDALRASPAWQDFIRRKGQAGGARVKLSDADRRELETELARAGLVLPEGMNIDPAGNINEKNQGVFQNKWVQAGLIAGAAAATMGAAGFGPLAGLMGGSAGSTAGGTAAAATLGNTGLPVIGAQSASSLLGVAPAAAAAAGGGAGAAGGGLLGTLGTIGRYGAAYGIQPIAGLIGQRMASNAKSRIATSKRRSRRSARSRRISAASGRTISGGSIRMLPPGKMRSAARLRC
jgi:hypothetical protein